MATQSKSQFLTDVHTQLKRRYKPKPDRSAGRLSVLEAVVYGICHEDTTREQANQALSRFKDQFFDWNEVRVSPIAEDPGDARRYPRPPGTRPADSPVPPPALREDLRVHPRGADQEAAQGGPQGPARIRGLLVRLRHGHRHPAGPRRPRHPRRFRDPPRPRAAGDLRSPISPPCVPSWSAPSPRTAASSSSSCSRSWPTTPASGRPRLPPLRAAQDLPLRPGPQAEPPTRRPTPTPTAKRFVRKERGRGRGSAARREALQEKEREGKEKTRAGLPVRSRPVAIVQELIRQGTPARPKSSRGKRAGGK